MAVKEQSAYAGAKSEDGDRPLPGLVWAFLFHPDGSSEGLPVDRPIAGHIDGWLWLHFDLPDGQAPQIPPSLSKLPPAAMELLAASDPRQQLHAEEGCIFGVFANLIGGRDQPDKGFGFVHFAMSERLLVSNRGQALEGLGAARKALLKGRKIASVAGLLIAIVEHVIDTVDDYAEQLASALDAIEEKIVAGEAGDERAKLGEIRRNAVRLHRQLVMSRSLINRFESSVTEPSLPFELPTVRLSQASRLAGQ